MRERPRTLEGKPKFWFNNPMPHRMHWEPKRPLVAKEKPAKLKQKVRQRHEKVERNRRICELRTQGLSMEKLAQMFGVHPTRIRRILDYNLTPEEGHVDDALSRAWQDVLHVTSAEVDQAVALRRSGMKFKDVAETIGRSLATTSKMLRQALPLEEHAALRRQGLAHQTGNIKNTTEKGQKRRDYDAQLKSGERKTDPRPWRGVTLLVEVESIQKGGRAFELTLDCGHVVREMGSRALGARKRCPLCPKQGTPSKVGEPPP